MFIMSHNIFTAHDAVGFTRINEGSNYLELLRAVASRSPYYAKILHRMERETRNSLGFSDRSPRGDEA